MELVIDKANVLTFLSHEDDDAVFECTRLIKKGIRLCFNFKKDEINPTTSEGEKILMWLETMTEGRGRKTPLPLWNHCINSANIETDFVTTLTAIQKRNAFLLDNREVVAKIREKGAILIGSVGQEVELILSLCLEDTETSTDKISSWIDYCPKLPLTDIIICDNHFFKNIYVYNKNKNDLINGLVQLPRQAPVNCVIIVQLNQIDRLFDIDGEIKELKKNLIEITGDDECAVTIITTYSTHDRNAITNYYRLTNGSCFHLKNNGLKADVTAEIKTHANVNYERRTNELISIYQEIINMDKNGKNIYGDKKSNFLSFPT